MSIINDLHEGFSRRFGPRKMLLLLEAVSLQGTAEGISPKQIGDQGVRALIADAAHESAMVCALLEGSDGANVHACTGIVKTATLTRCLRCHRTAPFWEGAWSMENLGPFLSASAVAARLRAQGKSCGDRTPYEWARQHSISVKIGGSRLFPTRFVELLLAGIPLAEIPAQLRERSQCATYELPTGRRSAGRQVERRGARRLRR